MDKAFDNMQHTFLVKLSKLGIEGNFFNIIYGGYKNLQVTS